MHCVFISVKERNPPLPPNICFTEVDSSIIYLSICTSPLVVCHFAFCFCENRALVAQITASLCRKELVWNARLQPTAEYPMEQLETETSRSPTGTVQSFSPTWEMLQVYLPILLSRVFFLFNRSHHVT